MPVCKSCGKKVLISALQPDKTHLCLACAKKVKREPRNKKQTVFLVLANLGIIIAALYGFIITFQAIQGNRDFGSDLLFPAGIIVLLIISKFFYAKVNSKS
jgi:hypothetical protein